MERSFYNDDFEDLIKQKADQYKMYPSDRVWKEVNRSLHPKKRWYWFGVVAILLSGAGYYSLHELSSKPAVAPLASSKQESPAAPIAAQDIKQPAQLIPFKNLETSQQKSDLASKRNSGEIAGTARVITMTPVLERSYIPGAYSDAVADHIAVIEPTINKEIFGTAPTKVLLDANNGLDIAPQKQLSIVDADASTHKVNWLQEYAVYELQVPKAKRLGWQLSFSPTMNYRKLTGSRNANLPGDIKSIPIALNIRGELDNLVNHKPALGFELGTAVIYSLNKNFSLKGGVQFNYSRYTIEAYSSATEIATIALTSQYGYRNDSISNLSQIRNFGGYASKDIQNQYFQLSAPVGLEWKILGNERLQLNIAGTIQPTYLLNRNTYLITTDYKSYTKEPSLVRRWNINSAAEAYISYRVGGVRWQLGPQFRYQLLSSYSSDYPIKEYLMEYGVKFGVTKTIR